MKIILVFPPNVKVIEPFRSCAVKPPGLMWGFPLGLSYLAAVLRNDGHKVSIIDACVDDLSVEEVLLRISRDPPDVVGIGSLTHTLKTALAIAQGVKAKDEGIRVIMGGPHATYDYEGLLGTGSIDYIVLGEGEQTFAELLKKLNDPVSVKGIAFMDQGAITRTPHRELIEDLDGLPFPARDMLDFRRYIKSYGVLEKSVDVMSSRGCTNRCVFCSSSHLFGRWRPRKVGAIVSEIKALAREFPEIRSINFMDDNFTADKKRVLALCEALTSERLNTYNWACLARVDQLDEEMVKIMKAAGCQRVHLGIESGSPEILKNINKRISLDQARAAVKLLKANRIEAYSFFMIGNPGETRQTIAMTKKFSLELNSSNTGYFIAQVFPGTRLEQLQPVKSWRDYIYEPEIEHPSIFTHPCVPNFIPQGFTRESLKKICSGITREIILLSFLKRWPKFIKKLIVEPRSTLDYLSKVFFK